MLILQASVQKYVSSRFLRIIGFGLFFQLITTPVLAEDCSVSTQPGHKASLIELYTSEGCSSCPPADKWLSEIKNRGAESNTFVPLSFHVDYWNYIGWIDPFSQSKFTQRQREIAARGRLSTIYTPQVVLNGKDYRAWRRQNTPALLKAISETVPQASIKMQISQQTSSKVKLSIKADVIRNNDAKNAQLFVAVYENNLTNSIASGENSGRVLSHDYVVRELSRPYVLLNGKSNFDIEHTVDIKSQWKRQDIGVAAFVQNRRNGDIYQAASISLNCKG